MSTATRLKLTKHAKIRWKQRGGDVTLREAADSAIPYGVEIDGDRYLQTQCGRMLVVHDNCVLTVLTGEQGSNSVACNGVNARSRETPKPYKPSAIPCQKNAPSGMTADMLAKLAVDHVMLGWGREARVAWMRENGFDLNGTPAMIYRAAFEGAHQMQTRILCAD